MAKGTHHRDAVSIEARTIRLMEDPFSTEGRWTPPMDCYETEQDLRINVHLPGVVLEDIDLTLYHNKLIIKGRRTITVEDNVHFHRIERPFGIFERTIMLPFTPDEDDIKATLKNGVLRIVINKKENKDDKR